MALEGRLRGRRGGSRALPAAIRRAHAPQRGPWSGRDPPHAGDAGGRRRAGAVPHAPFRGAAPAAAVLDAAPARLRRPAGGRRPPWRQRAGAQRGHGRARRHGQPRARAVRRRRAPPQRIRRHPGRAPGKAVPGRRRHGGRRRGGGRPAAGRTAHGRPDEPAVLGHAGRGPHPPRRGPAPRPLRVLDAARRRATRRDHVQGLPARQRRLERSVRPPRPARALRLHERRGRPRLRAKGDRIRHPSDRAGPEPGTVSGHRPVGLCSKRRRAARRRHRPGARPSARHAGCRHRAAVPGPLRPAPPPLLPRSGPAGAAPGRRKRRRHAPGDRSPNW